MSPNQKMMAARVILSVIAIVTIVSPFLADWNASHIYNPLWTPHAKFHNAQTMSMAVLLGIAALVFTWWKRGGTRGTFVAAFLFTSFYWVSQALAFLFPGVAWTDPNLLKVGQTLTQFPIQLKGDLVLFVVLTLAAWLYASASSRRPPSAQSAS
ncbi:MAG: DUF6640 family protein [Rhodanobacter sp.]